jgi:NHLM bacteriocin system ABC transporter peptidase/ATP-binding protein
MAETPAPTPPPEPPKVAPPPRRRVKTPTILQMEAVECGAAALAMVLAHYGRWVPLEELRHECGVSRDGSKANNVLRAARKFGLEAKGFKYENLDGLYPLDFPLILFWNFNHFVVLDGFNGPKVHINDPAQGPRVVTMDELDGSFSGVVLTFKKGPQFRKGGSSPSMVPALRRRLIGNEVPLLFAILCGLSLVIPGLVIPTFTRVFIDNYLLAGQSWLIKPLLWAMAGTIVVHGLLTFLQKQVLLRLETKLSLVTSSQFFNHILRLPASYFGQRFSGEIGSRVMINDRVAMMLSRRFVATVIDSLMTVFYAALMLTYDTALTLIVILISLLNVAAVRFSARARIDGTRRLMQDRGKLMGTSMNGLQMMETLKATGSETEFFARWAGYYAKTVNTQQSLEWIAQVQAMIPSFVQTLSTATVLVLGGLKVMSGDLTVGMLVAYQTLLWSFTRPLNSFVQFGSDLQEMQADMNRLDDVTRYPIDTQYDQTREKLRFEGRQVKLSGHVELRNVTFGYSPLEKPLIENFNLVVKPGRRVALVGGSGSGKSTVAKIVSGLYKAWEGEVLFDGIPRERLPRDLIANSLGVVDQEIFLFGGTVGENITMWDGTVPMARVSQSSRDAAIDDVIESREGGYQSKVQEGGGNFSGGQCQRLEISRSLVGEPTVMILDEATSALDPATEQHIDESLRRRGCTCLIIAHRLSTIRDADEIIVMDRGKIVQRGTHDELKDVTGAYQLLMMKH